MDISELSNYNLTSLYELDKLQSFDKDDLFMVSRTDNIFNRHYSNNVNYDVLSSDISKCCIKSIIGSDSVTTFRNKSTGEVVIGGDSGGVVFKQKQYYGNDIGKLTINGKTSTLKTGPLDIVTESEFKQSDKTYKIFDISVDGSQKSVYKPKEHQKTQVTIYKDIPQIGNIRIARINVDNHKTYLYTPNSGIGNYGIMLDTIYPLSSIYVSMISTDQCPIQTLFEQFEISTQWELVGQGKCLFGYSETRPEYQVSSEIQQGVPSFPRYLSGMIDFNGGHVENILPLKNSVWQGLNCIEKTGKRWKTETSSYDKLHCNVNPDQSQIHEIYGKCDEDRVQPPSIVVMFWKRTI